MGSDVVLQAIGAFREKLQGMFAIDTGGDYCFKMSKWIAQSPVTARENRSINIACIETKSRS